MTTAEITVKNNAPGWPAMVSNRMSRSKLLDDNHVMMKSSSDSLIQIKASKEAATMWMNTRYKRKDHPIASEALVSKTRFAPKVVRQCKYCQILYTNFHCC